MTVEQNPLEHFLCPSQKEKTQMLGQLKDITGVQDNVILENALNCTKNKSGEYDLDQAVNMLIDEKSKPKKQGDFEHHQIDLATEESAYKKEVSQEIDDHTDAIIDLTHETTVGVGVGSDSAMASSDKEDDLQKAIALSLQDQHVGGLGGQVTMEEQDISRVLEASLADNKSLCGTKRKRGIGGEIWQDPLNPHERERPQPKWPVGLKNVGNTCWFSSVIQSLFHLPIFLQLVLEFVPNKEFINDENISKHQKILFIQELRKLFALMVGTNRKYVDPSQVLYIFKEALDNSTNKQQDVSEFTHKLIEWLEDAYKFANTSSLVLNHPAFKDHRNPMSTLFYGRSKSEGLNEGHHFSNDINFGQLNLLVNGFSDIHESLEAAVTHEIESSSDNSMTKSGQGETWVTRLPPVLLLELSRFHFNQQLGVTEKIHNKLSFPDVIYMDRYLECNKQITRCKREEVRRLKEIRSKLHSRLQKYLNYGSGSKRVPLHDVLQYALEFVESNNNTLGDKSGQNQLPPHLSNDGTPVSKIGFKVETKTPTSFLLSAKGSPSLDVEMSSPASNTSVTMGSPCDSPLKSVSPAPNHPPATFSKTQIDNEACMAIPTPRHITESELNVFQTCLRRWRHEVENDVKELQEEVGKADHAIREIYNEPSLQKVPYKLHAVLVHEGQAASGHYWAYVMCPKRSVWLKCNDATITETNWAELQKDSVGGHKNASAYCLFYVDHRLYSCNAKQDVTEQDGDEASNSNLPFQSLDDLPEDLIKYVQGDNDQFEQEIQVWDSEQAKIKKDASTITNTVVADSNMDKTSLEAKNDQFVKNDKLRYIELKHAFLALNSTVSKLKRVAEIPRAVPLTPMETLNEAMKLESQRIQALASKGKDFLQEDTRLHHVAIYFIKNKLPWEPFIKRVLLEQFSIPPLLRQLPELGKEIRSCALSQIQNLQMSEQQLKEYAEWQKRYSTFRRIVNLFVTGVNNYHNKKYSDALPFLFDAYKINGTLVQTRQQESRGFNQALLANYRRRCLLDLNEEAVNLFQTVEEEDGNQTNTDQVISLMEYFIIPAMSFLNGKDGATNIEEKPFNCSNADSEATVAIRNSWCSLLGNSLSVEKQAKLGFFLTKLLEVNSPDAGSNNDTSPTTETKLRPGVLLCNEEQDLEKMFDETMALVQKSGVMDEVLNEIEQEAAS